MEIRLALGGFLLLCIVDSVAAADCPDAGVVVVASVFATLAVVFIVLGLIGFFLWKRNRDISRPEKPKHDGTDGSATAVGDKFAYSNPAFDKDPEMGDSGIPGYVPCRETSGLQHKNNSNHGRDMSQKTWSSLPGTGVPYARTRKSSVGSLDRNTYAGDEGPVEVWLTSQDFIGLGFNIAGSMRDGIFVSQVHNRGPANESGHFQVGDRIMSVGISFENMVYEDALTILSYASPYPVKVTLQKEQQIPKNRRLSDVRTNLNHPLYRSQSVDALNAIPKDNDMNSLRCTSAIRYDRRDSPQAQRTSKRSVLENNLIEESPSAATSFDNDVFQENTSPVSTVDAVVHRENTDSQMKLNFDREVSQVTETDLPTANEDLNHEGNLDDPQMTDSPFVAVNGSFSDAFKNLTEEDKLDVLRLSYADPEMIPDSPFDNIAQAKETDGNQLTVGEQKNIPAKPERKKKRSSTNSTPSQSDVEPISSPPITPKHGSIDVDDMMSENMLPPTESPPPLPPTEAPPLFNTEADEEIIMPETKARSVTIDSGTITFESVTPSKFDTSDISEGGDRTIVDVSFSDTSLTDIDTTLVPSTPSTKREESPTGYLVEEEFIAPTQIHKDQSVPINSKIFIQNSDECVTLSKDSNKLKTVNVNNNSDALDRGLGISTDAEPDFETMPKLDMDLGFDADSILFKETFPSRNTREHENGVAFDISVTELDAMGEKALEEEMAKSENNKGKGGIAFEIRDDLVTGETRTINTNSVHRTASYDIRSSSGKFIEHELSSQRPTSFKGEMKHHRDDVDGDGALDWSGKRLVRSGSFTEIPQDDSIKDWTDVQNLNDDDESFDKSLEEDSRSPVLSPVSSERVEIKGKDDLSDSDSQCRSLSSSASSEGTSPPRITRTNGEDDGLGISPDNSPVKISPISDLKSDLISAAPEYGDSPFTVELNSALDIDC